MLKDENSALAARAEVWGAAWLAWALGYWGTGALGQWGTGVRGHWGSGAVGYWGTGALGHWGRNELIMTVYVYGVHVF